MRLTVFSLFPHFDQWYFTLLGRSRNEKKIIIIQRSGQAHFLGASSLDSSPPDHLSLLAGLGRVTLVEPAGRVEMYSIP